MCEIPHFAGKTIFLDSSAVFSNSKKFSNRVNTVEMNR